MSSKWAKFHTTNRRNVYYSQARRQDFAAGGGINHKGGANFLNTILDVYPTTATKKSLATCKLYSHFTRPRNLYRYER